MSGDLDKLLSAGSVVALSKGLTFDQPVLKVLGHRKVPGGQEDRYRLLLTDGVETHSFVMLGTQLNHLIEEDQLVVGTVIRVKQHVVNNIKTDKPILILLQVEILGISDNLEAPIAAHKPSSSSLKPVSEGNKENGMHRGSPLRISHSLVIPQTPPNSNSFPSAGAGTPGSSGSLGRVFPISSLNPYQNKWTIRARVSQKSAVRTWSNARGEGKLFSFVVTDDSGEIRITCFKEDVDKYNDMIQVNKVIYVSRGQLKTANKQYNNTKNDYEMTLNSDSVIQFCEDEDASDIPQMQFTFVKLADLVSHSPNTFVDICGVVHECGQCQTIITKTTNKELQKRDIGLVDTSGVLVRCTLWGNEAVQFDGENEPVLVIKAAKVSDFNGRSLSVSNNSSLMINPSDIPDCLRLKGWYRSEGHSLNYDTFKSDGTGGAGGSTSITRLLCECKGGALGGGDKPDYFSTLATVIHIKKDNCMYKACPKPDCYKKVIEWTDGYRCEKCNLNTSTYKWRLMLQINLADFTDNQWVTCFQETGEVVLGCTTEELGQLKETNDEDGLDKIFQSALFRTFNFRLRAKMETYQDENRVKVTVMETKPINYQDACQRIITEMQAMGHY